MPGAEKETVYYHGGPVGLSQILPPSVTGTPNRLNELIQRALKAQNQMFRFGLVLIDRSEALRQLYGYLLHYRDDVVYATPDLLIAERQAARNACRSGPNAGYGAVYEVRPNGELEKYVQENIYVCPSAEIIRQHSVVPARRYRELDLAVEAKYPGPTVFFSADDLALIRVRLARELVRMGLLAPELAPAADPAETERIRQNLSRNRCW